jgi:ABC-type multidrug transport system fused ATPase/permease subunit
MSRRRSSTDEAPKVRLSREKLAAAAKIFRYIRPYRFAFGLGLVLLFLSSITFMIFPYLSGVMVDIASGEKEMSYSLVDIGWMLALILVIQGAVSYFRIYLFSIVSEKGISDVRKALYQKLISMPMSFFEHARVGELVSRLTADVEKLYSAFSITLAEFLRQIIILLAGIIFLAFRAPQLSLIMLGTFPVVIIGAMFFGRFIRKLSKERQEELAESNNILNETMQAIQAVKAFTNEFFESLRYGKRINRVVNMSLRYARWRALFSVFIVTFLFGALFFIIWQGAVMVQDGTMSVGLLIEFVAYTAIIGASIAGLGNFYTELVGAIGATERIREILEDEQEIDVLNIDNIPDAPVKGHIEYKEVSFRYPTRPDIEVLQGMSFEVRPGQKVALVGTSGAGKSTIVQLLLRFYEIDKGEILVDGQSITSFNTTAYRRNIAIVPQEVILFGGSIRENILYGKPKATEEAIIEAAKKANAWEFIQRFPEGLDTLVGERGVKLSGGQRQRIAIARAILKDPAILLLDEATSSLDAESERVVQDALATLMEGRTSIIIAHRLATIRDVDQIFVIDNGQIIEQGTHTELSQREKGAYNTLAKLQFEPI